MTQADLAPKIVTRIEERASLVPELATLVAAYRREPRALPPILLEPAYRGEPRFSLVPSARRSLGSVAGSVLVIQALAGVALFGALAFAAASHAIAHHPKTERLSPLIEVPAERPPSEEASVDPGAVIAAPTTIDAHYDAAAPAIRGSVLTPPRLVRVRAPASSLDPSVDAMLDAALASRSAGHEGSRLPALLSAREVTSTLRGLESEVAACGDGDVDVRLVIEGESGLVRAVSATGADAVTNACVASVVERAQFSRFERERFNVAFPYRSMGSR